MNESTAEKDLQELRLLALRGTSTHMELATFAASQCQLVSSVVDAIWRRASDLCEKQGDPALVNVANMALIAINLVDELAIECSVVQDRLLEAQAEEAPCLSS